MSTRRAGAADAGGRRDAARRRCRVLPRRARGRARGAERRPIARRGSPCRRRAPTSTSRSGPTATVRTVEGPGFFQPSWPLERSYWVAGSASREPLRARVAARRGRPAGLRLCTTRGSGRCSGRSSSDFRSTSCRPGQSICPYHYETGEEEWLIVLVGRPTLRTPAGEQELRPWDCAFFPAGEEGAHKVTNRTDERCACASGRTASPSRRRSTPTRRRWAPGRPASSSASPTRSTTTTASCPDSPSLVRRSRTRLASSTRRWPAERLVILVRRRRTRICRLACSGGGVHR